MNMKIELKEWKIVTDNSGCLKITGIYAVVFNGKEIASQSFNEYSAKNIAFNTETMLAVSKLTDLIKKELQMQLTGVIDE